jgi:peptidoglycan/xylan/chitin deacetylase (PgdA/CDA1 family)
MILHMKKPSKGSLIVSGVGFGLSCCVALFVALQCAAMPQAAGPKAIVVTVDDLPGAVPGTGSPSAFGDLSELQKLNRDIPQILKKHHAPGIGFVIGGKLDLLGQRDARAALLQSWLDAGMSLGNHTYTHQFIQSMTLEQFEDDTIRGDVVTREVMKAAGQEEKYFRHPGLMTGATAQDKKAFDQFLQERGYRVAPVTVDNDDYEFNDVLGTALEKGDAQLASATKDAYLAYMNYAFDYYEGLSRELFHREIPQILLIHDSELTAECLDAILTDLERRGYRFISLDEALKDPAYQTPDLYVGTQGFSWLGRWKLAFGQPAKLPNAPVPPDWVEKMSEEIRRSKAPRQGL